MLAKIYILFFLLPIILSQTTTTNITVGYVVTNYIFNPTTYDLKPLTPISSSTFNFSGQIFLLDIQKQIYIDDLKDKILLCSIDSYLKKIEKYYSYLKAIIISEDIKKKVNISDQVLMFSMKTIDYSKLVNNYFSIYHWYQTIGGILKYDKNNKNPIPSQYHTTSNSSSISYPSYPGGHKRPRENTDSPDDNSKDFSIISHTFINIISALISSLIIIIYIISLVILKERNKLSIHSILIKVPQFLFILSIANYFKPFAQGEDFTYYIIIYALFFLKALFKCFLFGTVLLFATGFGFLFFRTFDTRPKLFGTCIFFIDVIIEVIIEFYMEEIKFISSIKLIYMKDFLEYQFLLVFLFVVSRKKYISLYKQMKSEIHLHSEFSKVLILKFKIMTVVLSLSVIYCLIKLIFFSIFMIRKDNDHKLIEDENLLIDSIFVFLYLLTFIPRQFDELFFIETTFISERDYKADVSSSALDIVHSSKKLLKSVKERTPVVIMNPFYDKKIDSIGRLDIYNNVHVGYCYTDDEDEEEESFYFQ